MRHDVTHTAKRRTAAVDAVHRLGLRARAALRSTGAALVSPTVVVGALALAGVGTGVAAVHILAGIGWALAAGSAFCFVLAALVARGARRG